MMKCVSRFFLYFFSVYDDDDDDDNDDGDGGGEQTQARYWPKLPSDKLALISVA